MNLFPVILPSPQVLFIREKDALAGGDAGGDCNGVMYCFFVFYLIDSGEEAGAALRILLMLFCSGFLPLNGGGTVFPIHDCR
jgi:hypothetical protein